MAKQGGDTSQSHHPPKIEMRPKHGPTFWGVSDRRCPEAEFAALSQNVCVDEPADGIRIHEHRRQRKLQHLSVPRREGIAGRLPNRSLLRPISKAVHDEVSDGYRRQR